MCSAKMTGTCMRKLTALKNVTLSQGTPLSGGINSSIQRLSKKKKKQHQQFCVLGVMVFEDGFMAVG